MLSVHEVLKSESLAEQFIRLDVVLAALQHDVLQDEEVYLNECESVNQLRRALSKYFYFCNEEKPHQHFEYQTPMAIYRESTDQEKGCIFVDDSGCAKPAQAEACA